MQILAFSRRDPLDFFTQLLCGLLACLYCPMTTPKGELPVSIRRQSFKWLHDSSEWSVEISKVQSLRLITAQSRYSTTAAHPLDELMMPASPGADRRCRIEPDAAYDFWS